MKRDNGPCNHPPQFFKDRRLPCAPCDERRILYWAVAPDFGGLTFKPEYAAKTGFTEVRFERRTLFAYCEGPVEADGTPARVKLVFWDHVGDRA